MSETMIYLENVSKSYDGGKTYAVKNLTLTIDKGDFVALLGPSGCGKSTTLMMLCGLYRPTEGNIYFGNRLVNNVLPKDRNIGMVFQSYALYPNMSVFENIAFPLRQLKKLKKAEIRDRVEEVANTVRIPELLKRMPGQLSGGQQQRVAMCRALVKKPDILLLDEPMSNLDARLKLEIRDEIKILQQKLGLTSIIVTHDQEEAMAISSRIAIIADGCVQQYAPPNELYARPKNKFVASFVGTPPMNFIRGVLDGDLSVCRTSCGSIRIPRGMLDTELLTGREVSIGVRPHQFTITGPSEDALLLNVDYIENLGKEVLFKCYADEFSIRVLAPLDYTTYSEECLYVTPDSDAINVLDAQTGMNVSIR